VIVRENGVLKLVLQGGGRTTISAGTTLPANVLRYTSSDAKGQVFYAGGEPVYHGNTDPVQANRQFARLAAGGMTGQVDWVGAEHVNLTLGAGANDVLVERTDGASTTLNLGSGNDHVRVKSISGNLTINAGVGADGVEVFNDDARPIFIDYAHLSGAGNRPVAARIANEILAAGDRP